jgi:hypothetical protein
MQNSHRRGALVGSRRWIFPSVTIYDDAGKGVVSYSSEEMHHANLPHEFIFTLYISNLLRENHEKVLALIAE